MLVGVWPSTDARALAERLPRDATVLRSSGARFLASDPEEDVAVLAIVAEQDERFTAVPLGRSSGLRLGEQYPQPVVDLQWSRQRALEAFASLKAA